MLCYGVVVSLEKREKASLGQEGLQGTCWGWPDGYEEKDEGCSWQGTACAKPGQGGGKRGRFGELWAIWYGLIIIEWREGEMVDEYLYGQTLKAFECQGKRSFFRKKKKIHWRIFKQRIYLMVEEFQKKNWQGMGLEEGSQDRTACFPLGLPLISPPQRGPPWQPHLKQNHLFSLVVLHST